MIPLTNNQIEDNAFALSAFLKLIKNTLDNKFKGQYYWVRGELSEWKKHGTHYYGELIEYDDNTHQAIAKIRLNLWGSIASKIIPKFHHATGENIKPGMKVLFSVAVNFHPNYGMSLNIIDVDPDFTLGDREARKQKIIADLTQKGIAAHNKKLSLPLEFTNVAVISSENAAGLGDFFVEANALQKYHLCNFELYSAAMQGKECPVSVTQQFREIYKLINAGLKEYDAVVLIRGGGAQSDLDWFNYQAPAEAICHMPIPVLVGIGHERDSTVLDMLATRSFDTPSKVIHYIASTIINNGQTAWKHFTQIQSLAHHHCQKNQVALNEQCHRLTSLSKQMVKHHKEKCQHYYALSNSHAKNQINYHKQATLAYYTHITQSTKQINAVSYQTINTSNSNIRHLAKTVYHNHKTQLGQWTQQINQNAKGITGYAQKNIELQYQNILSLSIAPTLKRGFVLTQSEGKYITSAKQAEQCKQLTLTYHDGNITTEIQNDRAI